MRRTKSLLVIFALWAAALSGALGQIFTGNIVGYINLVVNPGLNLIVNQLGQTNDDLNTFMPNVPDGTVVFRHDPVAQSYRDGVTFLDGFGWYPASGDSNDAVKMIPLGEGFFVHIPGSTSTTITFVGEVLLESTNPIPGNFSLKGSIIPQSGQLVQMLGFTAADGDQVFQWDVSLQAFKAPAVFSSAGPWLPDEPSVAVGEGFLVNRNPAQATPDNWWIRHFSIGPGAPPAGVAAAAVKTVVHRATNPTIRRLTFPPGQVALQVRNFSGQPYDVQWSSDGEVWRTLAARQTGASWSGPFTPGARGYFRLDQTRN
jgi:hypothetical protein